jgi:hypothetical protein
VAHKEKKLGIRADDTAAYVFQDCRIPRDQLLGGDEGIPLESSGGFRGVMKTFNMTRPLVAAIGLGMAEAALDFTRDALAEIGITIAYGCGLQGQPAAAEKFVRLGRRSGPSSPRCAPVAGRPGQANNMVVDRQGQGRAAVRRSQVHRNPGRWPSPANTCSRSGSVTCASLTSTKAPARSAPDHRPRAAGVLTERFK